MASWLYRTSSLEETNRRVPCSLSPSDSCTSRGHTRDAPCVLYQTARGMSLAQRQSNLVPLLAPSLPSLPPGDRCNLPSAVRLTGPIAPRQCLVNDSEEDRGEGRRAGREERRRGKGKKKTRPRRAPVICDRLLIYYFSRTLLLIIAESRRASPPPSSCLQIALPANEREKRDDQDGVAAAIPTGRQAGRWTQLPLQSASQGQASW